ncbi:MAG: hypothetical protein M0P20_08870 [Methanocorpusculum sp.]|nr:hypothetical protein [Methanocorpusculum sp.]
MNIPNKIVIFLIIFFVLISFILVSSALIHNTYPEIPVNESDTSTTVVHIEFPFMDDVVTGDITLGLAPYYGAKTEVAKAAPLFYCSPDRYYSAFAYDPAQDEMYENLFRVFDSYAESHALTSDEYIELLTTYVQNIPYKTSKTEIRFPIETVIDDWGDCDDKSVLLAGLLDKKGYDAGVFVFRNDNHMAAGVKGGCQTEYRDSGYSIIETTRYAYVGEVPGLLHESSDYGDYSFYRIGNGTDLYTASWQVSTILNVRDTAYAALNLLYLGLNNLGTIIETEKGMLATPEYASNTTLRSEYDLNLNAYNKGVEESKNIRETLHMINSEPYNREKVYQTIVSLK